MKSVILWDFFELIKKKRWIRDYVTFCQVSIKSLTYYSFNFFFFLQICLIFTLLSSFLQIPYTGFIPTPFLYWILKNIVKLNILSIFEIFQSLKPFGNSWDNSYIPCLLLIITLGFTCGERKICSTIKKCQNIMNMIVTIIIAVYS